MGKRLLSYADVSALALAFNRHLCASLYGKLRPPLASYQQKTGLSPRDRGDGNPPSDQLDHRPQLHRVVPLLDTLASQHRCHGQPGRSQSGRSRRGDLRHRSEAALAAAVLARAKPDRDGVVQDETLPRSKSPPTFRRLDKWPQNLTIRCRCVGWGHRRELA